MSVVERSKRSINGFAMSAVVAAVAWLALAVIQAMNPTFDDVLNSPIDYTNDSVFTIALVSTAVAVIGLYLVGISPRPAALLVAGGYLLVATGVLAGLAQGHSPSWFAAVGIPGNLLGIIGMIWLGIAIIRHRSLPIWAGILAILAGLFAVVTSEFGTSVIAAIFWMYVGMQVYPHARDRLPLA
jgi:hypothetical protein